MDPIADLNLVGERIREALANLLSIKSDPVTQTLSDALKPLPEQLHALASKLTEPPPPPPKRPAKPPTMKADASVLAAPEKLLEVPGRVKAQFCEKHTPPASDVQQWIAALLAHPTPVDEDKITDDPGSVSKLWQETSTSESPTEPLPAPPPTPPRAPQPPAKPQRRKPKGDEVWDDFSQSEE